MTEYKVKRVYDEPSVDDGVRLLVDRLWPRGVSKKAAQIDHWAKEFTPTNELRKWFHEHPTDTEEFASKYRGELAQRVDEIKRTLRAFDRSPITLVTSTKLDRGHVAILKGFLDSLD